MIQAGVEVGCAYLTRFIFKVQSTYIKMIFHVMRYHHSPHSIHESNCLKIPLCCFMMEKLPEGVSG